MSSNLPTCCGYLAKSGKKADDSGAMIYAVWCETCGRKGTGPTPEQARAIFNKSSSTAIVNKIAPNRPPVRFDAAHVAEFVAENASELSSIVAPFVKENRPMFDRMVKKNVRYVMGLEGNSWAKVWASEDGRESIKDALDEAFMLGATLPDMGCMVPFGEVCEFIPDVEAYRFAVTTGSSAPFKNLEIEPIFDKDQYRITRKDGAFALEFTSILAERGDVKAIAVYGTNRAGKQIGEVYPVSRLIEKARTHSQSYRSYLQDVQAFEVAKQEGKVKRDGGREYIEKVIPKQDGTTWNKRIYLDELTNPYDGADRPEMLRKLAGKSFLAPYIKTRNSTAAIEELSEADDVNDLLDKALGQAFGAFEEAPPEPPRDEEPEPAAIPERPADLSLPSAKVPSKKPDKVPVKVQTPPEEEEGEGLF
jgi:hypothetical protein